MVSVYMVVKCSYIAKHIKISYLLAENLLWVLYVVVACLLYFTDWTHRYKLCTVNVIGNVKFTLSVARYCKMCLTYQLINALYIFFTF